MILASKSPRRLALLNEIGIDPCTMPVDVDESILPGEDGEQATHRLSKLKAKTLVEQLKNQHDHQIILAADSLVWDKNHVFGKPQTRQDAFLMLQHLSGNTHTVTTGVTIAYWDAKVDYYIYHSFTSSASVTFYDLTEQEISAYLDCGEYTDKAGAYAIQGKGRFFVKSINGDLNTIIGLPVNEVIRALQNINHDKSIIPSILKGADIHA